MTCKFQEEWIRRYDWIERVDDGDDYQAQCKLCWKKFSIKSMGVGAVNSLNNFRKNMKFFWIGGPD